MDCLALTFLRCLLSRIGHGGTGVSAEGREAGGSRGGYCKDLTFFLRCLCRIWSWRGFRPGLMLHGLDLSSLFTVRLGDGAWWLQARVGAWGFEARGTRKGFQARDTAYYDQERG